MENLEFKGSYQLNEKDLVVDPIISIDTVSDQYPLKKCTVSVLIISPGCTLGRIIGSFNYVDNWHDTDVITFINDFMKDCKQ